MPLICYTLISDKTEGASFFGLPVYKNHLPGFLMGDIFNFSSLIFDIVFFPDYFQLYKITNAYGFFGK